MYNNYMANFSYRAKKLNDIRHGVIIAENLADAALKLEQRGFVILEIKEDNKNIDLNNQDEITLSKLSLNIQEKKSFYSSLYSLYKSGCSLLSAFDSMYFSTNNPKIKILCAKILSGIKDGSSLNESTKKCSNALGVVYIKLLVAGEKSGKIEDVLANITKNIKMQEKVISSLISKTSYPAAILLLSIFVAIFFNTVALPIFNTKIAGESICWVSVLFSFFTQVIVVFLIIGGIIFALYKNKQLLNKVLSKLSLIGVIGNLVRNYNFSNFFAILSLSYSSGLSLVESMQLSSTVVKLPKEETILKKAARRVEKGCNLTTALGATSLFSDYAISQISSGEKSGELEENLISISLDYENKLITSLDVILKLIEPLALFIVGFAVLYLLIVSNSTLFESWFSFL